MSANLDATKLSPGLTVNDLAKSLRFYEGPSRPNSVPS